MPYYCLSYLAAVLINIYRALPFIYHHMSYHYSFSQESWAGTHTSTTCTAGNGQHEHKTETQVNTQRT